MAANLDADDPIDDSDDGNSDSDSDSDDDTAALMAELQKIKREKAAEEREKEEAFSRPSTNQPLDNIHKPDAIIFKVVSPQLQ